MMVRGTGFTWRTSRGLAVGASVNPMGGLNSILTGTHGSISLIDRARCQGASLP